MRVFVTGATGFVGSHVAEQLEAMGADVRVLVRETSRTENLEMLKAERVVGDLRDFESLKKGMAGCEFVFHVAADYRLWTRNPSDMYASNVGGTMMVIRAAQELGVRRVIYTSSVATMGFGRNGDAVSEATPVDRTMMIGHYKKSKWDAERVAMSMVKRGADVVIVNPSTPIGERDIKPTPTGQIVVDFLKKKFPAYVDTGLNLVDVRDCARGHIAAMERGRSGERYILGGENLTLKQILDKLAAITGLPSPKVKLPYAVALATGVVDTVFTGYLLRKEPRVTIDAVRMGRKKMFVSSAKAESEIGYKAGSAEDGLRRAAEWFRTHGYA